MEEISIPKNPSPIHPVTEFIAQSSSFLEGSVVPRMWYKAIRMPNGKADANGILVLSEVMFWYTPTFRFDKANGIHVLASKFDGDMLQKSYQQLSDTLGLTKNQVRGAVDRLVEGGYLRREFRNIVQGGVHLSNVMFLEPVLARVISISEPASESELAYFMYPQQNVDKTVENVENTAIPNETPVQEICENNHTPYRNIIGHGGSKTGELRQKDTPIELESDTYTVNNNTYETAQCTVNGNSALTELNSAADNPSLLAEDGITMALSSVMSSRVEEGRPPVSEQEGKFRPAHKQVFAILSSDSKRVQDEETQWKFSLGHLEDLDDAALLVGLSLDDVVEAVRLVHGRIGSCGRNVSFWLNDFKDNVVSELARIASVASSATWADVSRMGWSV